MTARDVRRMRCPECGQQISPMKALFGLTKRPFHCSRCDEVIEIAPNRSWALLVVALLAFWRINATYDDMLTKALGLLLIALILAVTQLFLTPVRRASFD